MNIFLWKTGRGPRFTDPLRDNGLSHSLCLPGTQDLEISTSTAHPLCCLCRDKQILDCSLVTYDVSLVNACTLHHVLATTPFQCQTTQKNTFPKILHDRL